MANLIEFVLRFGQFIASTLPTAGSIDAERVHPFDIRDLQTQLFSSGTFLQFFLLRAYY